MTFWDSLKKTLTFILCVYRGGEGQPQYSFLISALRYAYNMLEITESI